MWRIHRRRHSLCITPPLPPQQLHFTTMDLIAAGYGSSSSDSEGDSSRPSKAPKLTTSTALTVNVAPDVSLEVIKHPRVKQSMDDSATHVDIGHRKECCCPIEERVQRELTIMHVLPSNIGPQLRSPHLHQPNRHHTRRQPVVRLDAAARQRTRQPLCLNRNAGQEERLDRTRRGEHVLGSRL